MYIYIYILYIYKGKADIVLPKRVLENGNGKILRVEIEWRVVNNAVMLRFEAIARDIISTKFWPGISEKRCVLSFLSLSFLSVLIIATHHCNCSADTSMQIFFFQTNSLLSDFFQPRSLHQSLCISCRVVSCRNRVVSVSRYTRTCSNNRCRLKYHLSLFLSPLSFSRFRSSK